MLQLLVKLHRADDGLSGASHERLLEMMTHSKNPERISKAVPAGSIVAHKTGTMPGGVVNDTAIVTSADGKHHLALVIFATKAKEPEVIATAKSVYERFAP